MIMNNIQHCTCSRCHMLIVVVESADYGGGGSLAEAPVVAGQLLVETVSERFLYVEVVY